jgi:hypothetical protein
VQGRMAGNDVGRQRHRKTASRGFDIPIASPWNQSRSLEPA